MASTQIGAIHVEASIGTAKYVAGAKQLRTETQRTEAVVKKSFSGMGAAAKAGIAGFIGALSVGALTQGIRAALNYASAIGDVSAQLGVTTRDLQTFRFAAGQLGVDQQTLETGLKNLTVTLGRVAAGAAKPTKALEAIGLNAKEIAKLDTGEAFRRIADAMSKYGNQAERAAVATVLMQEAGAKLDPLLAGGSRALNELAAAADKLGIVLSDEQIEKADQTADKLDAIKTVLSARIAGVVADNADAILDFTNALSDLAGALAPVVGWLARLGQEMSSLAASAPTWAQNIVGALIPGLNQLNMAMAFAQQVSGSSSVTMKLPPARPARGASIGQFLARGGGGRSRRGRTGRQPRDDSARDLFRFEQDELRAQMDILRAKQQLSSDYVERTTLGIGILDLERRSYENQLKFDVSQKDITQAQADRLMLLYDQKDSLERQKLLAEEEESRAEEFNRLREVDFDIQREALEAQLQLAETAKDRRDLELRLLDLTYRQERARLEAVLADEQSSYAAKEEARRRLAALNANFAADRQGVINRTRGPMEEWSAQFRDIGEELEELKVRGIMGAIDLITTFEGKWDDLADTAINSIRSIIQELLRLQLMKFVAGLIGGPSGTVGANSLGGGLATPGFAAGGSFSVLGQRGIDRNVLSLNGLPIARVSFGERISVSNDNSSRMPPPFVFNNYARMSDAEARRTGMQAAAGWNAEMSRARAKGIS